MYCGVYVISAHAIMLITFLCATIYANITHRVGSCFRPYATNAANFAVIGALRVLPLPCQRMHKCHVRFALSIFVPAFLAVTSHVRTTTAYSSLFLMSALCSIAICLKRRTYATSAWSSEERWIYSSGACTFSSL